MHAAITGVPEHMGEVFAVDIDIGFLDGACRCHVAIFHSRMSVDGCEIVAVHPLVKRDHEALKFFQAWIDLDIPTACTVQAVGAFATELLFFDASGLHFLKTI